MGYQDRYRFLREDPNNKDVAAAIRALNAASCCHPPDGAEEVWRADDPRWQGSRIDPSSPRKRLGTFLANLMVCSACFRFRGSPAHWMTCR